MNMAKPFRSFVTEKFYDCNANKIKYYNEEPYKTVLDYFKANKHFLINKYRSKRT